MTYFCKWFAVIQILHVWFMVLSVARDELLDVVGIPVCPMALEYFSCTGVDRCWSNYEYP